jgi:hypothetical protein
VAAGNKAAISAPATVSRSGNPLMGQA